MFENKPRGHQEPGQRTPRLRIFQRLVGDALSNAKIISIQPALGIIEPFVGTKPPFDWNDPNNDQPIVSERLVQQPDQRPPVDWQDYESAETSEIIGSPAKTAPSNLPLEPKEKPWLKDDQFNGDPKVVNYLTALY